MPIPLQTTSDQMASFAGSDVSVSSKVSKGEGTVDAKVLGGIYFGLVALATLQLIRVLFSKTRRIWSLQSAYLALCLAWCLCRALYFSIVFEYSESCMGFRCVGGSGDGGICALANTTVPPMKQCPGGQCLSNSVVSCEGQHILFGLPTMIQSLMLATLIFFYALWVHKANGYFYRRRVFFLVAIVNGIYYVSFFLWVFLVRCGDPSVSWAQCSWCKTAMNAVTGLTLFVLSLTLSYFSWKLYVHAQSAPPSTVQAPSGRRKIISINMLIVFLFVSHGILSVFSLSPDRQDNLPCPMLLFPHAIICIVAEVFPALLLLLHFRRISRPSLGQTKEDPKAFENRDPSRPEEVYNDMSSTSSSASSDNDEEENQLSDDGGGRESSLFSDLNRYESSTHGIFQSSPNFREPLL